MEQGQPQQIDKVLENFFTHTLPALPENVKAGIVKWTPWFDLLMMIFLLPILLFALGLGTVLAPFAILGGGYYGGGFYVVSLIVSIVAVILQLIALPGLFHRTQSGWKYAFYAVWVHFVYRLFDYNIVGAIVGTGVSLYVLYQIRSYYKN
ncbi:MAG: hypothetical protein Q7S66_01475 [bacterium]|nr:hypothetical protein [bacterium]